MNIFDMSLREGKEKIKNRSKYCGYNSIVKYLLRIQKVLVSITCKQTSKITAKCYYIYLKLQMCVDAQRNVSEFSIH